MTGRDPVVERVIAEFARTSRDARTADAKAVDAAHIADLSWGVGDRDDALRAKEAADAADVGARSTSAARVSSAHDLEAAWQCATLEDLLTCDRPAVRMAARMALAPTPTTPKRKP